MPLFLHLTVVSHTQTVLVARQLLVSERSSKTQPPSDSDTAHSAIVHATNATLPVSFTQDQVLAAINNPGASAWGRYNKVTGLWVHGLNISSIKVSALVTLSATFFNPMPDANYSVVQALRLQKRTGVNQANFHKLTRRTI